MMILTDPPGKEAVFSPVDEFTTLIVTVKPEHFGKTRAIKIVLHKGEGFRIVGIGRVRTDIPWI